MVSKEIDQILEMAGLLKTAAYEAVVHSQSGNESMCETKVMDVQSRVRDVSRMLKELDHKIEYIKNQS